RHLTTKTGLKVLVHDRDPAPLQRLAEHGAQTATPDEISAQADIIFLSLPPAKVVEKAVLAFQDDGLLAKGRSAQRMVDLSTSPVDLSRRVAAELAKRDLRFADAPVMRTRAAAEAGTLAVPVGADDDVFASIKPLLDTFASDVTHVGG